ncbi:MAG: cupin domain-containing protein [Candidatus Eremiobacteraeota bacterium]|nr:cupin domain-containing protein [Candidatus Eremiobacteraeota bacterium]
MRFFKGSLTLALLGALVSTVFAASSPTVVMPGKEHWVKQDGGYSMAVLYGDPSKDGYYVVRLKTGANWTFAPHYHPGRENITVISGVFYAGMGKKMDMKKLTAYPAGSFMSVPANTVHYAMTKEPAIIELSGTEALKDVMAK